ncbi:MAG: exo-alpha-sialidase [Planctomycetota bacterium]
MTSNKIRSIALTALLAAGLGFVAGYLSGRNTSTPTEPRPHHPADNSADTPDDTGPAPAEKAFVPMSGAVAAWSFDDVTSDTVPDVASGKHPGRALGSPTLVPGVRGHCMVFDGQGDHVAVPDAPALSFTDATFSLSAWVNVYSIDRGQQVIVGKNCYTLDQREWSLMVDRDNHLRFFMRRDEAWKTVDSQTVPIPGRWMHLVATVDHGTVTLYVNGTAKGKAMLSSTVADTAAPLTFGATNNDGTLMQMLHGAVDEVQLVDGVLSQDRITELARHTPEPHDTPWTRWARQAEADARHDRSTIVFDGQSPDKLVCDATLRKMPDGSWVMVMLGGGDTEPLPQNRVFITRSTDAGKTWSGLEPIDLGIKSKNPSAALVPSELMAIGDRATMFVATHDGTFADWKEWMTHSDDSGRTWSTLEPAPGRLHERTFIRNHIVTRDGRIMLPFQHYTKVAKTRKISKERNFSPPTDPRNGVLISDDGGKSWTEHGNIRLTRNNNYHGWAENNIVELSDGRIAMIIRADRLGGVLYYAESKDGGRTWPEMARKTTIPNPGSKATLYGLGGDTVAMLHNPNPRHRSPLALWISFDGMTTWPYRRVLVEQSCDGPKGRLNYPDGFLGKDRTYLHFTFDDNRHRAVYVGARLPEVD